MFYFPYKILQAMLLFLFSLSSFDYQGSNIPATDPWPPYILTSGMYFLSCEEHYE